MSDTDLCPTCGGDCGTDECETLAEANEAARADGFDDWDDEPCYHEHNEWCEDSGCDHQHCMNCGGCQCPGYCDDLATYNLRPFGETGGDS